MKLLRMAYHFLIMLKIGLRIEKSWLMFVKNLVIFNQVISMIRILKKFRYNDQKNQMKFIDSIINIIVLVFYFVSL